MSSSRFYWISKNINCWKISGNLRKIIPKRSSFHADCYSSWPWDRFLEAEQRFACMEAETDGNFRQKFRKFLRTFENFRKILGKFRNVSKKNQKRLRSFEIFRKIFGNFRNLTKKIRKPLRIFENFLKIFGNFRKLSRVFRRLSVTIHVNFWKICGNWYPHHL